MHPEADALLDAIFDHPNEDAPRLVYADWLQEHGYEDYAQFIRLSARITRGTFLPTEHKQLRQERYLLGQQLERMYPGAWHVTRAKGHPLDGIPRRFFSTDVKDFLEAWPNWWPLDGIPRRSFSTNAKGLLETWPDWWPFLHPRVLELREVSGHEVEVARCPYLARIETLRCEGGVMAGSSTERDELEWQPVNIRLLRELAANPNLPRLTALEVDPITVTREELMTFAASPLAKQLEEFILWAEVAPNYYERLRAIAGNVRDEIHRFISEHLTE